PTVVIHHLRAPRPAATLATRSTIRRHRLAHFSRAGVGQFSRGLKMDRLIAQLEPSSRELLRLLTAFEPPIPVAVAADVGILAGITDRARRMEAIERMIT